MQLKRWSRVRRWLLAVGLAFGYGVVAASANAGIAEFNAAMKQGDVKAASLEAVAIWETWDTANPDTALMAREFGFVSLMAGETKAAQMFGKFLVEQGGGLATPDDQPLTSAVLYHAAQYQISEADTDLARLRAALEARTQGPGADLTSVMAWELLYFGDWNSGKLSEVETDATSAAAFMARVPASLLPRQRKAELYAAAAMFMSQGRSISSGRLETYDRMADLHDAIVGDLGSSPSEVDRKALWDLKWKTEAWALAIGSFLESNYQQTGSNINTSLKARPLASPTVGYRREDPSVAQVPLCKGEFKGRKIRYPSSRAYAGMVGSVIVRLEVDAQGKVTEVEKLASVPSEEFSDAVVKAASEWSREPDPSSDTSKCRLASSNYIYRVIFYIG